MVQKILRTMQDDLREAKEKNKKADSSEKKETKERLNESAKQQKPENSGIKKPIPKEEGTGKAIAPEMQPPISDKPVSEEKKPTIQEEIKNELEKMPGDLKVRASEVKKEGASSKPREQEKDAELSELIKRVSASMQKSAPAQPKPQEPAKPDKDRELKEIIERMSRNMKKENELLREEEIQPKAPQQKPTKPEEEKSATSFLKNIFHKPESEKDEIEDDYKKEEKPKDTYWEKMHDTLKNSPNNTPEKEIIDEIKKGIMMEPKKPVQEKKIDPAVQEPKIIPPETPAKPAAPISPISPKETQKPQHAELRKPEQEVKAKAAGIIVPEKKAGSGAKDKLDKDTSKEELSYISPENRLIFGKQEYYSSIRKRIKLKNEEKNLEGLEETLKQNEIKLSDTEEKKMLRHQIIKKYRIKLFTLPWAKIIIFTILFLGTLGTGLYLILPKIAPVDESPVEIINGENIAEIDSKLTREVSAKQKSISALNYFDGSLEPWNTYRKGDIIEVKISYDDYSILLPRDEALKSILGKEQFGNIPPAFLDTISQKYSVLAFKRENDLRLGLAFKFDSAKETQLRSTMLEWEKTGTRNAKIYNVMKNLFTGSKLKEEGITSFQPAIYRDVELKYINLPDTNTSIDYVIYGDTIFFTTSKDTTFQMIDLLKD